MAPPYSRYYMGGEDDMRGFDIYTIGPFAFIPTESSVTALNDDGSTRNRYWWAQMALGASFP